MTKEREAPNIQIMPEGQLTEEVLEGEKEVLEKVRHDGSVTGSTVTDPVICTLSDGKRTRTERRDRSKR